MDQSLYLLFKDLSCLLLAVPAWLMYSCRFTASCRLPRGAQPACGGAALAAPFQWCGNLLQELVKVTSADGSTAPCTSLFGNGVLPVTQADKTAEVIFYHKCSPCGLKQLDEYVTLFI